MITLLLVLFGLSAVLELGVTSVPIVWPARRYLAAMALLLVSFAAGGTVAGNWNGFAILLLMVSAYRAFNLLRIVEGRIHQVFLRRVARQTAWWLVSAQAVIGLTWLAAHHLSLSFHVWWLVLAVAEVVGAFVVSSATVRRMRRTRPQLSEKHLSDQELPALTVAIPARNEDEQLEACLRSVIASNYPKLEVLVLDDCSQDRTPEIIRGFAHDGVRFIAGRPPETDLWLAKNAAYERLYKEASGELVLFCGVDVRFEPQTIRELVITLHTRHKAMLSVMPSSERSRVSIVQSIRYFWELALPRRMFGRPPVLSSCWMIAASELKRLGGFAAVSRSVVPEAYFAREAANHQDGYRFMHSGTQLGVTTVKSVVEQRATALRTQYPRLHRRPEMVCLVTIAELLLLLAPFGLVFMALAGLWGLVVAGVALVSCLLLLATYHFIVAVTFPRAPSTVAMIFPLSVLVDVALLHYSMWQYEFSEVIWKGRNVCIPVMRVIPRLPKLPKT